MVLDWRSTVARDGVLVWLCILLSCMVMYSFGIVMFRHVMVRLYTVMCRYSRVWSCRTGSGYGKVRSGIAVSRCSLAMQYNVMV